MPGQGQTKWFRRPVWSTGWTVPLAFRPSMSNSQPISRWTQSWSLTQFFNYPSSRGPPTPTLLLLFCFKKKKKYLLSIGLSLNEYILPLKYPPQSPKLLTFLPGQLSSLWKKYLDFQNLFTRHWFLKSLMLHLVNNKYSVLVNFPHYA